MELKELIKYARDNKCSDLHITAGEAVAVRKYGELQLLDITPSIEEAEEMIFSILGDEDIQTVQAGKDDKSFVRLVDEELEGITAQVVAPIICEGDAIGAVAIMSREPRARFGEMELKLAATACGFLGRQMES